MDQTSHRLYFDGVKVAGVSVATSPLVTNNDEFLIGRFSSTPAIFRGDIDGPTVYARALGPVEIGELYTTGATLLCDDVGVLAEVNYEYDADGAVEQAPDVTMTYDPATGLLDTVSLGDLTKTFTYNDFGELFTESTEVRSTQTVRHEASYVPDPLGRVSQRTETIEGVTVTHDYRYDDAGRLEEVLRDGARVAFLHLRPQRESQDRRTPNPNDQPQTTTHSGVS